MRRLLPSRASLREAAPRWLREITGFRIWGPRALVALASAAMADPRLVLRHGPPLTLNRRRWREFQLQVHGKDYLRDVYTAAAIAGLRPMLFWGTLLGVVREAGFIRGDHDLDLAVAPEDFLRRAAFIHAMQALGYTTVEERGNHVNFRRHDRLLYVDADFMTTDDGDLVTKGVRVDGTRVVNRFRTGLVAPPRPAVVMGDVAVYLPHDPEGLLAAIYGDWQTPRPAYNSASDPLTQTVSPPAPG